MATKRSAWSFSSNGSIPDILFILMSWTFWSWKSSPPSLSLSGMLEGQNPPGLCKGCLASEGQRGSKAQSFLPLLLWRSSPGMFCCNPSRFIKVTCLLFLFAAFPPPVPSNDSGHAFSYLICRCPVRVLISFFYLILYLKCLSLSHLNRLFLDLRHQRNYFFPDPAPSIGSIR